MKTSVSMRNLDMNSRVGWGKSVSQAGVALINQLSRRLKEKGFL